MYSQTAETLSSGYGELVQKDIMSVVRALYASQSNVEVHTVDWAEII